MEDLRAAQFQCVLAQAIKELQLVQMLPVLDLQQDDHEAPARSWLEILRPTSHAIGRPLLFGPEGEGFCQACFVLHFGEVGWGGERQKRSAEMSGT